MESTNEGTSQSESNGWQRFLRSISLSSAKALIERVLKHIPPRPKNFAKLGETSDSFLEPPKFKRPVGYKVESVDMVRREDLTTNDIIVAVMGPTGAGKSTFIQTVTGQDNGVGHGLVSCTSEVTAVRVTFTDGIRVVLVDTPGFNDTYLSDLDILKMIAEWLRDVHRNGLRLLGILYLHRISDNRMGGTPLKNLTMFKKLCGEDFFEKVILTTTMWPRPSDDNEIACVERGGLDENLDIYVKREQELLKHYWAEMTKRGSLTRRFMNTQTSAWEILDHFITTEYRRRWIRIQEELVDEGKKLPNTEAGQQLHGLFGELIEKQNDLLKRMKDEVGKTRDPEIVSTLLDELTSLRREREKAMKDMRRLNPSRLGSVRRSLSALYRGPSAGWRDSVRLKVGPRRAKTMVKSPQDHQDPVAQLQQQKYNHIEPLEQSPAELPIGSDAEAASSPIEGSRQDATSDIKLVPQYDSPEQLKDESGQTSDLVKDHTTLEMPSSDTVVQVQALIPQIGVNDRWAAATTGLQGEDAQCVVDVIDATLRQMNTHPADRGKRALFLLCELAKSASVFPRCYELRGVKYDFPSGVNPTDVLKGKYENQVICVKVVRLLQNEDGSQILRAHSEELVLWAHLSHQNILPFYGVYLEKESQRICFVSPWMENGNLRDYLRIRPESPRMPLVSDIINGLCYLHDLGIVHGDLKAQNILVSDNGMALIANHSVSRVVMSTLTCNRSPKEAMPSMGDCDDHVSSPTRENDIWLFSCLCYEIFTCKEATYQNPNNSTALAVLVQPPEIPPRPESKDGCNHIDDAMWDIMTRCWNRVPQERPTCKDLWVFFEGLKLSDVRPRTPVQGEDNRAFWKAVCAKSTQEVDYQRAYQILTRVNGDDVDAYFYGVDGADPAEYVKERKRAEITGPGFTINL